MSQPAKYKVFGIISVPLAVCLVCTSFLCLIWIPAIVGIAALLTWTFGFAGISDSKDNNVDCSPVCEPSNEIPEAVWWDAKDLNLDRDQYKKIQNRPNPVKVEYL